MSEENKVTDADIEKYMPQPKTYHILCMLMEVDKAYESGLIKADKVVQFEELLTPIMRVIELGPDAYADKSRFPSGPSCKPGDYIVVRANSGTRLRISGKEYRIINDDNVEAVVTDPRYITRV